MPHTTSRLSDIEVALTTRTTQNAIPSSTEIASGSDAPAMSAGDYYNTTVSADYYSTTNKPFPKKKTHEEKQIEALRADVVKLNGGLNAITQKYDDLRKEYDEIMENIMDGKINV